MKKAYYLLFLLTIYQACSSPIGEDVDERISTSYYYQPFTGNIIYSPDGNWFERDYQKLEEDKVSFRPLAQNVAKDKYNVFYEKYLQQNVDVVSFNVINRVMLDKQFVYTLGDDHQLIPIEGADPGTFEYLKPSSTNTLEWAKDDSNYYFDDQRVDVDYSSFVIVNENMFYDKDSIYIVNYSGISGIDVSYGQIIALNLSYSKSDKCLFYSVNQGYQKLVVSKFDSIEFLTSEVLKVDNRVVYQGEVYPVKSVDFKTFFYIPKSGGYFRDKNAIYYENEVLIEADVQTFKMVHGPNDEFLEYGLDRHHVYWMGGVVENANPKTFHYDKTKHQWTDGENTFTGSELNPNRK